MEGLVKMRNLIEDQFCKYKKGDEVFHVTNKDGEAGVIINWRFHGYTSKIDYVVSFAPGHTIVMNEEELDSSKPSYAM